MAIKNGLDPQKVHFDFEDKILSKEEWDELDNFFYEEGHVVKKNKDLFRFNTEKLKFDKELYKYLRESDCSLEKRGNLLQISVNMQFRNGKNLTDLYNTIAQFPEIFSEQLLLEVRAKLEE